jgi:hypothetical protein
MDKIASAPGIKEPGDGDAVAEGAGREVKLRQGKDAEAEPFSGKAWN